MFRLKRIKLSIGDTPTRTKRIKFQPAINYSRISFSRYNASNDASHVSIMRVKRYLRVAFRLIKISFNTALILLVLVQGSNMPQVILERY